MAAGALLVREADPEPGGGAYELVLVGAGGGALHLLQKSGIKEAKGFGGFPVGGQWLRCTNSELVDQHQAKVYSQASVGAPPMSVPHLDTRVIGDGDPPDPRGRGDHAPGILEAHGAPGTGQAVLQLPDEESAVAVALAAGLRLGLGESGDRDRQEADDEKGNPFQNACPMPM